MSRIPSLNLGDHINHIVADIDWLAEHGPGCPHDSAMLCPICGTPETSIAHGDTWEDCYLLSFPFPDAPGDLQIRTRDARCIVPNKQNTGLSVHIPMECSAGHGWLLSIGHGASNSEGGFDGWCRFDVMVDEQHYESHAQQLKDDAEAQRLAREAERA